MSRPKIRRTAIPFAFFAALCTSAIAATQIASNIPFTLPLADNTTGQALVLTAPNSTAYLIYATKTGDLAAYAITAIGPQPGPIPPPPPPPVPTKLTIAVVEDPRTTTQLQRDVLSDNAWRRLAADRHTFLGIVPKDVIEKGTGTPPALLAPFLDRAKLHLCPWIMFTDPTGRIVWEGNVPATPDALTNLILQYGN